VSAAKPSRLAWALLLTAPVLMTSNMLTARWLHGSIPPVSLAFGRWLLTFLFLLPFTFRALWHCRTDLAREWPNLLLLGALGMGVCGPPVYLGGQTTTATNIGLIYSTTPILIVLFARLFWKEPVSARQTVGIAVSLAGVVIIIARGHFETLRQLAFTAGDLWIVLATVGWSLYSVLLKYRPSRLGLTARLAAITFGGVLSLVPFLGLELALGHWPAFDTRTLGVWTFLALIPGLSAYLLYGKLVSMLGPSRTGLLMYLVPVYNAGLAYLLLGEAPQPFHLVGVLLILPGIWLATTAERR
jgi:drug/metabolite transporter (DMT)-like permease